MRSATNYYCSVGMLVMALVSMGCLPGYAQIHTLSIIVSDSSRLPVGNASVRLNRKDFVVDSTGYRSWSLPAGRYTLSVTAVGHYAATVLLTLGRDTSLNIVLQARESLLHNVVVSASRHVQRNQMSVQAINIAQIKKLPVVLGETDPLKTITLLPGVKNGGEAGAGIYVRGGGPDQNLVLLDNIPIYNPNHLLGFFSVFNGDAISGIEVMKGGMPAEYGGRLSSVIAVDTRNGNKDSLKMQGGIGLISSRLSLEGPLVKKKLSFLISARRTYIDQVARLVAKDTIGDNSYYFYDVNAKISYQLDKNNELGFTGYIGKDAFTYVDGDEDGPGRVFNAEWGNTILGLTWKQQVSKKLKQELAIVRNDFDLDTRVTVGINGLILGSGLTDYGIRNDWAYGSDNSLTWKAGWQYTAHSFRPGAGSSSSGFQEFKSQVNDQYAREAAAYLSMDLSITPRLNLIAGMRYSYFDQVGPTSHVIYGPDGSPSGESEVYKKGESIARYHYPEPRINLLYRLPGAASIKLSYTRTVQYLHLATTSAATFPSDLWIPSGKQVKPGNAEQLTAGYFKDLGNGAYEMNVEAYYKTLSNQIEFKPGAQLLLNQDLEGEMIFGSGKAYGIEFFLQKKTGRLTGWIGYTLSRAERTFPGMNDGKPFPYRYDRTHDVSVVASYKLSKKWEASGVFVYGTGNALTMPAGRFVYNIGYDGEDRRPLFTNINQYDKINDYRMPAYHRMDIAFSWTPNPDSKKRFKSSWNFSLYNVYNRYNPYFIYFDAKDNEQTIRGKKVFLFPVLPGITWNFKW